MPLSLGNDSGYCTSKGEKDVGRDRDGGLDRDHQKARLDDLRSHGLCEARFPLTLPSCVQLTCRQLNTWTSSLGFSEHVLQKCEAVARTQMVSQHCVHPGIHAHPSSSTLEWEPSSAADRLVLGGEELIPLPG